MRCIEAAVGATHDRRVVQVAARVELRHASGKVVAAELVALGLNATVDVVHEALVRRHGQPNCGAVSVRQRERDFATDPHRLCVAYHQLTQTLHEHLVWHVQHEM